MPEGQKIEYSQLETGYQFPASSYQLDKSVVTAYLKAVEDTSSLYQDTELVPPMAIAAYAMVALSESMYLPPGTIHVSQKFEFINTVSINDVLVSNATVSRKQSRGKLHLLTVDLSVSDQRQNTVLVGRSSFILPEPDEDGEK